MKKTISVTLPSVMIFSALLSMPLSSHGQTGLLFDGDFESGTFQGWTPSGENGGFATVAAKGSCFSGSDTTAISFNGNPTSNYSALLRSNAAGETGSVASLRSQPFEAGNGIIFSALSETLSDDPRDHPVDLVVKIINSDGEVISEQPYRTAIIQLAQGCPSEPRDTAFSGHFIDTHHLAGNEISIEFNQNTRNQGLGYFTLIDDVVFIDRSSFLLSTSQPRAVAGTGITSSGTFFLDPRASTDPDDAPIELNYSWFINGDTSIRELDVPCVNLNTDVQLSAGNNIATLYVNDGFSYSADTIRFVIPAESSNNNQDSTATDNNDDSTDDETDTENIDGDGTGTPTLTDPLNECDVNLTAEFIDPPTDPDTDGDGNPTTPVVDGDTTRPSISVTGDATFTIGGDPVPLVSDASISLSSAGTAIRSATITIAVPANGDVLSLANPPAGLQVDANADGDQNVSLMITVEDGGQVTDEDFETAIANTVYSYIVPAEVTDPITGTRSISYKVNDGRDSLLVRSNVTVNEP